MVGPGGADLVVKCRGRDTGGAASSPGSGGCPGLCDPGRSFGGKAGQGYDHTEDGIAIIAFTTPPTASVLVKTNTRIQSGQRAPGSTCTRPATRRRRKVAIMRGSLPARAYQKIIAKAIDGVFAGEMVLAELGIDSAHPPPTHPVPSEPVWGWKVLVQRGLKVFPIVR